MDYFPDNAASLSILRTALITGFLCTCSVTAAVAEDHSACQASGWDMAKELKAYGGAASEVTAGGATWNVPILWADTFYSVALRRQSDVHFVQESPNAPRAAVGFAGLTRFTVLSSGRYRVTVDTALWIDAVDATDIVAPSNYITWHECPFYRKSVEYRLQAGQSILLQLSAASIATTKVTIEPVTE